MKKMIIALIVGFVLAIVSGPMANAQMAKEGSLTGMTFYSGTMKVIAMEKERAQVNYEVTGISRGQDEQSPLYNTSIHCLGSLHAIKGPYENDSGFCVFARTDGDQIFMTYEAKGRMGVTDGSVSGKGTWRLVGGTGKCAGIDGSGVFERHGLRAAAPGTFNSFTTSKGTYKLP